MSDAHALHISLLKPAILHILRASGFHSTRPSVLDTLTDLCARYLLLLGQNTAISIYNRTANTHSKDTPNNNTPSTILTQFELPPTHQPTDAQVPTLSDIRHALDSISFFPLTLTASEEAWREVLRRPLPTYPAGAARDKERRRRDVEDTRDVREFIDWAMGPQNKEIRRVAGMQSESSGSSSSAAAAGATLDAIAGAAASTSAAPRKDAGLDGESSPVGMKVTDSRDPAGTLQAELVGGVDGILGVGVGVGAAGVGAAKSARDDYVAVLKKKHSKTGDGARYAGTALGKAADERGPVRIEGGPESLAAWAVAVKRKRIEVEGDGGG